MPRLSLADPQGWRLPQPLPNIHPKAPRLQAVPGGPPLPPTTSPEGLDPPLPPSLPSGHSRLLSGPLSARWDQLGSHHPPARGPPALGTL